MTLAREIVNADSKTESDRSGICDAPPAARAQARPLRIRLIALNIKGSLPVAQEALAGHAASLRRRIVAVRAAIFRAPSIAGWAGRSEIDSPYRLIHRPAEWRPPIPLSDAIPGAARPGS